MTHTITVQVRSFFADADAEYMSDRLRAAGITNLADPNVDAITVNRIRLNAEHVKATGANWTPSW